MTSSYSRILLCEIFSFLKTHLVLTQSTNKGHQVLSEQWPLAAYQRKMLAGSSETLASRFRATLLSHWIHQLLQRGLFLFFPPDLSAHLTGDRAHRGAISEKEQRPTWGQEVPSRGGWPLQCLSCTAAQRPAANGFTPAPAENNARHTELHRFPQMRVIRQRIIRQRKITQSYLSRCSWLPGRGVKHCCRRQSEVLQNTGKCLEEQETWTWAWRGVIRVGALSTRSRVRKQLKGHGHRLPENTNLLPVLQFPDHSLKDHSKRQR